MAVEWKSQHDAVRSPHPSLHHPEHAFRVWIAMHAGVCVDTVVWLDTPLASIQRLHHRCHRADVISGKEHTIRQTNRGVRPRSWIARPRRASSSQLIRLRQTVTLPQLFDCCVTLSTPSPMSLLSQRRHATHLSQPSSSTSFTSYPPYASMVHQRRGLPSSQNRPQQQTGTSWSCEALIAG